MSFNLDNYTTVNERTIDFYKQYPAGVITTQPAKIVEVGGNLFISVIARVYLDRHMEDAPVTEAEAWEPYPGTTPYTRNSEMMNCATSAIGRALGQLGIGIEKGMASNDEVKVAQQRTPAGEHPQGTAQRAYPANDKQKNYVRVLADKASTTLETIIEDGSAAKICGRYDVTVDNLTSNDIDKLVTAFKAYTGETKITKRAPAVEDDPWAGEVLA